MIPPYTDTTVYRIVPLENAPGYVQVKTHVNHSTD